MIKYDNTDNSFHEDLKRAVAGYFAKRNKLQTGDWRLYLKSAILLASAFIFYWYIIFVPMSGWITLALCALLGAIFALIGFNIMHDASHKSYSRKEWVNNMMLFSLEMMGCSSFLWYEKHVIMHHTYTNTDHDDDIDAYPFLRIGPEQKALRFHKYQQWYAWLLYLTLYLRWVWYTDFKEYAKKKIGWRKIKDMAIKDHISFWSGKAFHGIFMIGLPIYHFGIIDFIYGYCILAAICGLIISTIFQLAHVVEGREFPTANANGMINEAWAEKQVTTTSNFATRSIVAFFLLGGLNFQIEHHLFPKISHIHYRNLSSIVREVCADHGIMYSKMTFFAAIGSHFRMLKLCGRN